MIPGFVEETKALTDKEKAAANLIANGLRLRIGKEKSITSKDIIKSMRPYGYQLTGPRIRKIINYLRITGKVSRICATSNGYFVAQTREELAEYIESLTIRISAQQEILNVAKSDLAKMP